MKDFIIYGAGDFADIVRYYIEKDLKCNVACYTVESKFIEQEEKGGLPVVPFEKLEMRFKPCDYFVAIGIVGRGMFQVRALAYNAIKEKGYEMPNIIHSTASNCAETIGDANIIMDNSVIGPMCRIGCGNIIWPCVSIAHQNVVGDFNQFAGCSSSVGMIEIGSHCFIGNNCTLNAKIADYTFVGAGTYIRKNTEEYGVYTTPREVKLDRRSVDIY